MRKHWHVSRRAALVAVLGLVASLGFGAVAVAATRGIALTPSVMSTSLLPGMSRTVTISVAGTAGYSGPVALSISATKPAGVTLALSSTSARTGTHRYLTVRTSTSTPTSTFTIKVKGVSGSFVASTSVRVSVSQTGKPLTLTVVGSPTVPGPGQSVSVDVAVTNPNPLPVRVRRIGLTIASVTKAPSAPGGMPCGTADFTTTGYVGPATPLVAPGATVRLSVLVPDRSLWPHLTMLNAPTNQDGCRGASLRLGLTGQGVS